MAAYFIETGGLLQPTDDEAAATHIIGPNGMLQPIHDPVAAVFGNDLQAGFDALSAQYGADNVLQSLITGSPLITSNPLSSDQSAPQHSPVDDLGSTVTSIVSDVLSAPAALLPEPVGNLVETIGQGVAQTVGGVLDTVTSLTDTVTSLTDTLLFNPVHDAGSGVVSGLLNTVSDTIASLPLVGHASDGLLGGDGLLGSIVAPHSDAAPPADTGHANVLDLLTSAVPGLGEAGTPHLETGGHGLLGLGIGGLI